MQGTKWPRMAFVALLAIACNRAAPVRDGSANEGPKPSRSVCEPASTPPAPPGAIVDGCQGGSQRISVGQFAVVNVCGDERFAVYEVTPDGILREHEVSSACRLFFSGLRPGQARVELWRARECAGQAPPDSSFCIDVE